MWLDGEKGGVRGGEDMLGVWIVGDGAVRMVGGWDRIDGFMGDGRGEMELGGWKWRCELDGSGEVC